MSRHRASLPALDIESEFESLAAQWHEATDDLASATRAVAHPSYLRIVSLGSPAVPLILKDLHDNGGLWFAALSAITGLALGTEADRASYKRMRELWLAWGRESDLV
jgi:hypothetical protein